MHKVGGSLVKVGLVALQTWWIIGVSVGVLLSFRFNYSNLDSFGPHLNLEFL